MNIGNFTKKGDKFSGKIETPLFVASVMIYPIPEDKKVANGPSFRVYIGKGEIGAAWLETAEKVGEYLSLKIDGPALPAPINCALFKNTEDAGYRLVWDRQE